MQITIRTSDDLMLKIEKIAKEMGLKKSDITRMALTKFADEYSSENEEQKPYNRVKHLNTMKLNYYPDIEKSPPGFVPADE